MFRVANIVVSSLALSIALTACGDWILGSGGLTGLSKERASLRGNIMVGYQGWFTAPGDGNSSDLWVHWSRNHVPPAGQGELTVEMYPDLSEFDPKELAASPAMSMPDGSPAYFYSGRNEAVIRRHFEWMRQYRIDGAYVQRFVSVLERNEQIARHKDAVLWGAKDAAEKTGRAFCVTYDVSGASEDFWSTLKEDWKRLVDEGIVTSPNYLQHDGKPLVMIWGMGFVNGVHPPEDARQAVEIVDWFHQAPESGGRYNAAVMGGVPSYWRNLERDSRTDSSWMDYYLSLDVLSPWAVGRFGDEAGADHFHQTVTKQDLAFLADKGVDYMPVVWPGFSWRNLMQTRGQEKPLNQIPRNAGRFMWRQAHQAVDAGASMLYVAMFDEVDEATAIYKIAADASQVPAQGTWLTLDADGYALPNDWYLQVTEKVGQLLRGEIARSEQLPLDLPLKR
jgi:hypothetical protein